MTTTPALTARQFRTAAERIFRKANPEAVAAGLVIKWQETSRPITWPTGATGRWGRFLAISPGHQTRVLSADLTDGHGMSVR
jgi:hypothetical protein